MSRLRSLLGAARKADGGLLMRDRDGYRLNMAEDQLDLLVFRRDVEDAHTAWSSGDIEQACKLFERALGSWRGEPLSDIAVLRGHPAVVAVAAERAAAVLEYADAAAGGGWHERVLPHLRALAARDRLDEVGRARLMTALAGSGRQGEALGVYEDLRQRLDDQLGVLPGPALRDAHAKVLRQEIRSGAESVWPDGTRDRWAPAFQLPAALADFTGRAADCESIISALTSGDGQPGVPVVTISGLPGVGKTSVALFAAHQVQALFPDGQLWVQLAGASALPRDPGDILGELLRAMGMSGAAIPDQCTERAACYRSRLAGRKVLVVADDAATAAQVRPLVPGTAGCALVVTSRAWLEGLEAAHLMPLDVMPADDTVSLLTRIIGQHRVAAEPEAAGELVRACGALPLAVRIAGAKLAARPVWPLSAMVRRLASEHDRLRELEAGDLSVRASIASSYESLPERAARAFRLLALLGASDFAEWVIGALLGEPNAADVAGELASRSLLTPLGADTTGEPRYRLHDLLRDYAAQQLHDESPTGKSEALDRLLQGWLQLAMMADARLPPEPYFPPPVQLPRPAVLPSQEAERLTADPIAWFTAERGNLLAAVEQACNAERLDLARQLASCHCAFQHIQNRYADAERLWRTIAGTSDRLADPAQAAYARLRVGAWMVGRGLAAEAFPILDECVEGFERTGEIEILAFALYWRGACAWDLDDFERARSDSERGIAVAHQVRSRLAELLNLRNLSDALARIGDGDRAVATSERAFTIATDLGVPTYELAALHNLALTCTLSERYDRAVSVCLRRVEMSQRLGDIREEAVSLGVLGDAYYGLARYEEAAGVLLRALPVFRDQHAHRYIGLCLLKLGYVYQALGGLPEAIDYLNESLLTFHQLRLPRKAEEAQQALDRSRATTTVPGESASRQIGFGLLWKGNRRSGYEYRAVLSRWPTA